METHLSMMLLVTASLLITAFSFSIGTDEKAYNDLFELRSLQSSSLAYCILSYGKEEGRPFVETIAEDVLPLCIVWSGTGALLVEGGPPEGIGQLEEVLEHSPDGSGCLICIYLEDAPSPDIEEGAAVHRSIFGEGRVLYVTLPLVRGGASYKGVVF